MSSSGALTPAQIQRLLDGPAGSPPAGLAPDFNDPYSNGQVIYGVVGLMLGISTLSIAIRWSTRLYPNKILVLEDYVIVLTWLLAIGTLTPFMLAIPLGVGTHSWNVRLGLWLHALYYVYVTSIFYGLAVATAKIAILLQIRRIFAPIRQTNQTLWFGCWFLIATIPCVYTITTIFEITLCQPREKTWNPFLPGHCFSGPKLNMTTGVFNIISDLAILVLPIPTIYGLQIGIWRKSCIMAVFAVGIIACVTSVLRFYYSYLLQSAIDTTWIVSLEGACAGAEIGTGILVFCLPTFPKFLDIARGKIVSTVHGSGNRLRNDSYATTATETFDRSTGGTIHVSKSFATYTEKLPSFDAGRVNCQQRVPGDVGRSLSGAGVRLTELESGCDEIELNRF